MARLLDSLGKTLPTVAEPNGSLDIIVVDNAPSDDRTHTLVDEWAEHGTFSSHGPG